MKRRNFGCELGKVPVMLPMIDMAWLTLAFSLAMGEFDVIPISLPNMVPDRPATGVERPAILPVTITNECHILVRKTPVAIDQVAALIAAEEKPNQIVLISVQTTSDGSGPMQTFGALLNELRRARLPNEVKWATKSSAMGTNRVAAREGRT